MKAARKFRARRAPWGASRHERPPASAAAARAWSALARALPGALLVRESSPAPVGSRAIRGHGVRCYWRCPHVPEPALPCHVAGDYLRTLAIQLRGNVTNARRLATRFILGAHLRDKECSCSRPDRCYGGSASAAPAALTLTENWNPAGNRPGVVLDDAPCGVAEASPVEFHDGGMSAVEVGDRQGDLYGLNLQNGAVTPGWGGQDRQRRRPGPRMQRSRGEDGGEGDQRDRRSRKAHPSTRLPRSPTATAGCTSAARRSLAVDQLLRRVRAERDGRPGTRSSPIRRTDTAPDGGVQASLPIANGGALVEEGSLGRRAYALNARETPRWPRDGRSSPPTACSPTAAAGDLYGTGSDDFRGGYAPSQGALRSSGPTMLNGGHMRIYNDHGGLMVARHERGSRLVPRRRPDPGGRRVRHRNGHGQPHLGVSDQNTVKVYDTKCNQVWSTTLDGLHEREPCAGGRAGQWSTGCGGEPTTRTDRGLSTP